MAEPVKPRPYRSERRREQAETTRTRVLDAAAALFREGGYAGTSIAAIAAAAGVSPETVYARFGNKRSLIGELVQRAVRGDDPRPAPEQEGARALAAVRDQREQVGLFASDVVVRLERATPVFAVVAAAARSEPELAELVTRLHADRLTNLGRFVAALAANGPLRGDEEVATRTVWALASPELYQLLVGRGGWTRERYRAWLADSLASLLLVGGEAGEPQHEPE